MLKSAYKNNKVSFVCFSVAIFLILVGFIISCFPHVEVLYSSYYLYNYVYFLDLYQVAILIACALSLFLLTKNGDFGRGLKTLSYSIIIAALTQSFLFDLFCEIFAVYEYYFSLETLFVFLCDFLTLCACILLLITNLKNLSSLFNLISTGIVVVAFIIQFVFRIIILIDYFTYINLFCTLFSFIVPLFFIGDLFVVLKKVKTPNNAYSSAIEKELYALKVKLELGSITKEEYGTKTAQIISKI